MHTNWLFLIKNQISKETGCHGIILSVTLNFSVIHQYWMPHYPFIFLFLWHLTLQFVSSFLICYLLFPVSLLMNFIPPSVQQCRCYLMDVSMTLHFFNTLSLSTLLYLFKHHFYVANSLFYKLFPELPPEMWTIIFNWS